MSGSSFSDPIPHTDKITQRLLRSGMPLTLKTARRQRTMLLAISGIVAILAHATFLLQTVALLRKVRHRGVCKVDWIFTFACAAYNLVRMRNLAAVPAL